MAYTAGPTRTIVLVGPMLTATRDDSDADMRAREFVAWAEGVGVDTRQLPAPGHWAHPDADAAHRRRLARADRAALVGVLASLRRELGANAAPVPLVLAVEEVAGQAGRAWLQRLREASEEARLPLRRAVRVSLDEPLGSAQLDRLVLGVQARS